MPTLTDDLSPAEELRGLIDDFLGDHPELQAPGKTGAAVLLVVGALS